MSDGYMNSDIEGTTLTPQACSGEVGGQEKVFRGLFLINRERSELLIKNQKQSSDSEHLNGFVRYEQSKRPPFLALICPAIVDGLPQDTMLFAYVDTVGASTLCPVGTDNAGLLAIIIKIYPQIYPHSANARRFRGTVRIRS
jgi:hypothetical protein